MRSLRPLLPALAAFALAACGDSGSSASSSSAGNTGSIVLRASGSFTGPHGGQHVHGALIRPSDGATLEIQSGTVAVAGDPAFVFTFAPVDLGTAYQVRYWTDHDGSGDCEAPPTDHQWQVDAAAGQTTVAVDHNTTFTDVCSTFTFPLTFVADSTFTGPHPNQQFRIALVEGGATTPAETQSGTVGNTGANPGFSVTFARKLFIGEAYSVKLWIDSTPDGTCQAPPTDHQWSVAIPTTIANHPTTFTYTHTATFTSVCSFFP